MINDNAKSSVYCAATQKYLPSQPLSWKRRNRRHKFPSCQDCIRDHPFITETPTNRKPFMPTSSASNVIPARVASREINVQPHVCESTTTNDYAAWRLGYNDRLNDTRIKSSSAFETSKHIAVKSSPKPVGGWIISHSATQQTSLAWSRHLW